MGRFIFSRLVVGDASASKKHRDGVAFLFERVHLVLLPILVCVIALGQANAQFAQQGSKLVGTSSEGSVPLQGTAVALSSDGNTAIIGGYGDGNYVGAVWVWTRSAGVWSQQGSKLVGNDAVGSQIYQGQSVSLSSDGNTAIVGGWRDNSDTGAAWVWTRSDGIWTQQGSKLVGTGSTGGVPLQGTAVALSSDGNTAIVGGSGDNGNVGAAWVFTRSGGVWTQQGTKLVGSNPGGSAQQGASVSLSSDGNTAIVGGYFDNGGAGAVWVWTRSAGVWTQQGTKLVGTGAVNPARQGQSVSLSSDGNTAFVGGYTDNSQVGSAWVWTRSGVSWTQQGGKLVGTGVVGFTLQGISVSLSSDGNTAIVGGSRDNGFAGAAWVWTRSGSVWTQQGSKLVGAGAVGPGEQGLSVCLSSDGSTAIVGGYNDNSGEGAAWIYTTPYPNPAIIPLLSAGTYGALSFGGITGSANVQGDVGSSNSAVDVNIHPTGTNWTTVNNAHNLQAQTDLGLALSDALSRTANATIAADALGGQVLRRGVYEGGALDLAGGDTLWLNGGATDVFIIKATSTLTINVGGTVLLTGGAVWSNIFWYVGSDATIFSGTTFNGIILAVSSITVNATATLVTARLLAHTGAVTIDSDVLPVELVAFTATANRLNADLHWSTATERNSYGFEIERRQTANWEKVGFVTGAGTSNAPQHYSYTDNNLSPGRYAYRIQQTDRTGKSTYTPEATVEVGMAPREFWLSQNYPNPFNPSTMIEFSVPQDGRAVLKIVDLLGRDLATLFEGEAKSGYFQRVVFDASKLASGVYFSRLEFGGKQQLKKMILMK